MRASPIPPLQLVLIDPSEIVRRGLRDVFSSQQTVPIRIVGEAADGPGGLAECLKAKPDVVLLEITLADKSGLTLCREISHRLPATRLLVLTSQLDDRLAYDAVTAGASGLLLKHIHPARLVEAVRDAAAGKSILDPDTTTRVFAWVRQAKDSGQTAGSLARLSAQEYRVLACVAEGLTNKQAGTRLGLSENTVKNYLVSAFGKLGVKRRSQAAALYVTQAKVKGK